MSIGDKMKNKINKNLYRLIVVTVLIIFGVLFGYFASNQFNNNEMTEEQKQILEDMDINEDDLYIPPKVAMTSYGILFGALAVGFYGDKFLMDRWVNNFPAKIILGFFVYIFCVMFIGVFGLIPFYVYNIYKLIKK